MNVIVISGSPGRDFQDFCVAADAILESNRFRQVANAGDLVVYISVGGDANTVKNLLMKDDRHKSNFKVFYGRLSQG
jgi:hypothetical protein